MHSYLRAVGFSKVRSREEIKEIIGDTVRNYDAKKAVEDHNVSISGFLWLIKAIFFDNLIFSSS